MANLSNINNILRVSSSGVGINKNNTGPSELDIESAGADIIDMTRTNLKTYRFAISGASAFSLFDVAAGVDRLTIDSSGNSTFAGNVNINKSSPYITLNDSSAANQQLAITQSGSTANFQTRGGASTKGQFIFKQTDGTTSSNALIINQQSNATFIGNVTTGGQVTVPAGYSVNIGTSRIHSAATSYLLGGNVGIGTDLPTANLNVVGPGDANDPVVAIDVTNSSAFNHGLEIFDANLTDGETVLMAIGKAGSTKNTAIFGYIHDADGGNDNLATIGFWGADNKMTVSAGGNVGIGTGTTSPTAKLDIAAGSIYGINISGTGQLQNAPTGNYDHLYTPRLRLGYMTGTNIGTIASNGGDSGISLITHSSSTGWKESLRVQPNGNVGIGTNSPNYQLEVRTTTNNRAIQAVNSTTSGTNWGFQGGAFGVGASKNIGLQINVEGASTNYAALLIGGNVGIGNTGPTSTLSVGTGTTNSPSQICQLAGSGSGIYSVLSLTNTYANTVAGGGTALDFHINANYSPTARIAAISEVTSVSTALAFYSYSNNLIERMRITSGGTILPGGDNSQNFGSASLRWSVVYSANGVNTSDETLKENIKECDLGIDFINTLKPKSYNFKDLDKTHQDYGKKHYGLIAQDLKDGLLKDSVDGEKDGEYGLMYNDLIAPMIKAIQELKAEIEILKNK